MFTSAGINRSSVGDLVRKALVGAPASSGLRSCGSDSDSKLCARTPPVPLLTITHRGPMSGDVRFGRVVDSWPMRTNDSGHATGDPNVLLRAMMSPNATSRLSLSLAGPVRWGSGGVSTPQQAFVLPVGTVTFL